MQIKSYVSQIWSLALIRRPSARIAAQGLIALAVGYFALLTPCRAAESGKMTVTFLELKAHGLAVVLETPTGKAYLYDTGARSGDYDAGRDTIAPFLKARGIDDIAGIVISHPHGDHYGGAPWLLEHYKVGKWIDSGYVGRDKTEAHRQQMAAYGQIRQRAQERGAIYQAIQRGDRLDWGEGIEVEALSPPREFFQLDSDPAKVSDHGLINANSLTLRIQHGKNVFVFPGDAYGSIGDYLLQFPRERLITTVLAAPHHGFNPSAFPDLTKPAVVVASCQKDYSGNAHLSYPRSPADHAAMAFGNVGSRVYSTAWNGNVQIVSDAQEYSVQAARERSAPDLRITWEKNFLTIAGEFPGKVIRVNYLEAFCRPGSTNRDWRETIIGHRTELVAASEDHRRIRLRSTLDDGVIVDHDIAALGDEIDFRLRASNPTSIESLAHWAQPCIRLDQFVGVKATPASEEYLPKCFVFLDGRLTRLPAPLWATQGRYVPGQVWCPAAVDRNDVNPRPLSSQVPSNGLIGCYSSDDRWVFATAFEPYQELFQGVIVCLHSDLRIGGLKAGETKQIRGKLYLMPADIPALLKRYEADFPEHVRGNARDR